MHRATPSSSSFRGYSSGGSRSVVTEVDDKKFMQEMAGRFMHNEARKAIEAAQNFGFTSVTMDAVKNALGKIIGSAETFISFIGGNRGFPAAGNIDDRRHRLMGLLKGEVSMFATQGMKQQFHFSQDGMFGSAPQDKTMRFALLDEDSEKDMTSQSLQQQAGGGNVGVAATIHVDRKGVIHKFRDVFPRGITNHFDIVPFDSGSGAGSGDGATSGAAADGMKMGQKSLKDKNKKASRFFEITKDSTKCAGKIVQLIMAGSSGGGGGGGATTLDASGGGGGGQDSQGTVLAEASSDGIFYGGGTPSKGSFAKVITLKGPSPTHYGKYA